MSYALVWAAFKKCTLKEDLGYGEGERGGRILRGSKRRRKSNIEKERERD